jgi:anti-sigma factor RsiW
MDCATVRGKLAEYVDGQLPAGSRRAVEAHLAACARCRAELALLREVDEALATWPVLAEPDGLTARVMAGIRAGETKAASRSRLTLRVLPHLRVRWQDAVLGLALALTVVVLFVSARYTRTAGMVEWMALDLYARRSLSTIERAWYIARTDAGHVRANIGHIFGWVSGGIVLVAATATAAVLAAQWSRVSMNPFRRGRR